MAVEKDIKKYSNLVKVLLVVAFGISLFFAILKKPELPEEIRKNITYSDFVTIGGLRAESGWSVLKDGDNYIALGDTQSFGGGSTDLYVIKTDGNGGLIWTTAVGDEFKNIGIDIVKANKGYIIVGGTQSEEGDEDIYMVKIDNKGEKVWEKYYGGTNYDFAYSVEKTSDNNYILCGYSSSYNDTVNSDIYLLKFDEQGKALFEQVFGGDKWDIAYSIKETKDKGFIITGYTDSFGNGQTDVILIKTDVNGNSLWAKSYGGVRQDRGASVLQVSDGGFLIAGKTTSFLSKGMGWDMYLVKTDSDGEKLWELILPSSETEIGDSVIETKDGFIITGTKKCYGICDSNAYVIKADADGNTVWWKYFAGMQDERAHEIVDGGNDEYVVVGTTLSQGNGNGDVFLMKIDKDGKQVW